MLTDAQVRTATTVCPQAWHTLPGLMVKYVPIPAETMTATVLFDLDHTLIKPKSGRVFPTDEHDWTWWHPSVPDQVRALVSSGASVVVLSNQRHVKDPAALQRKMDAILTALKVSVTVLFSLEDDVYRKPRPGMWEWYCFAAAGVHPNRWPGKVVYVGDAAGRVGDFAATDRVFAHNAGLEFATPEQYFLGQSERLPPLVPSWRPSDNVGVSASIPFVALSVPPPQLVVLVAPPASGKTTLARQMESVGFVRVNQDTFKTLNKCLRVAATALAAGQSVVVDNTNLSETTRKEWIGLAHKHGVPCRCLAISATQEMCRTLAIYRWLNAARQVDPEHHDARYIPSIVFHKAFKSRTDPSVEEGFDEVYIIPFRFTPPSHDPVAMRLSQLFLL